MKPEIQRYNANERTNHWIVAILFFMAGLSGLALFHPALFPLSSLFGGGTWTRILHPFMGVAMFLFFAFLVIRFWRHNKMAAEKPRGPRRSKTCRTTATEKLRQSARSNPGPRYRAR